MSGTGEQTPPTNPPAPTNPTNQFAPITSQADFDRLIQDRIEQAKRTTAAQYTDYDDLKAKAEKLAALEREQETAAEKAAREARETAARETETRLTATHTQEIGKLKGRLIRQAIEAEARENGFAHPEDVIERIVGNLEAAGVTISDDYEVKGVDKAVEKVAKERPEWLVGGNGGGTGLLTSPPGGRGGGGGTATYDQEALIAERAGRLGYAGAGKRRI